MNDKLLFEIIKYVAVFFVSILLPKKLIYFTRNFISYCLKTALKFLFIYFTEILVFVILHLNKEKFLFENYISYKNLILLIIITIIITTSVQILYIIFSKPKSFFTIYPTFTIKEGEFIASDIQSETINKIITKKIEFLEQKFYVYRNKKIKSSLANTPAFLAIIIGLDWYKILISKKLNLENPISIYFQKDLLDSEINVELFYDKMQFININLFNEIEFFTSIIGKSKESSIENKIGDILHLYYFITSQSHLDLTVDFKLFDQSFSILNDLEEQLPLITERFKKYEFEDQPINEFFNSWKGIIKRYYSIIFIEKSDYKKAVDFIFDANDSNPYFPQSSYEIAKTQYIAKYLSEMLPKVKETAKELEIENYDNEQHNRLTKNYVSKLEYEDYTYNYQILIEIINRNNENKDLISYIEKKLQDNEMENHNIFSLIFTAESYKYLPTETGEKINSIYIDRIPKITQLLERAINLDEEFELLYLRIATLKFLYATDKEEHMEEALKYTSNHIYLYSKYGLQ